MVNNCEAFSPQTGIQASGNEIHVVKKNFRNHTGKNNRFPFLDIFGYLKNTHKNPKFGRVRQVSIRELGWEFPGTHILAARLATMCESGMVTTEQKQVSKLHWRTYGSQLRNLFWQRFIFFGQVDFMFGQPKSAKYLSDGQVK